MTEVQSAASATQKNGGSGEAAGYRSQALDLLRTVVADLHQVKAQNPTASEVRLRMGAESNGSFSVERLGFRRFREFLEAGENAGVVSLVDRPGDIYVVPFSTARRERMKRLRPDIWRAIVDWSGGPSYWNVITRRAVSLNIDVAEYKDIDKDELIEIPKLGADRQMNLLRSFLLNLDFDADLRSSLVSGLSDQDSISSTVRRIKNLRPDLARDWSFELRHAVDEVVAQWRDGDDRLKDVELHVSPVEPRPSEPTAPSPHGSNTLRALVHRAIDRMSEEELRSLALPVGYLYSEI